MGNKCCSKRQEPDLTLSYPSGYKKNESSFSSNISGQKHNNGGSLDSRYTPDPNRGQLKTKGGVDIIRPRTTPCKYYFFFIFFFFIVSFIIGTYGAL